MPLRRVEPGHPKNSLFRKILDPGILAQGVSVAETSGIGVEMSAGRDERSGPRGGGGGKKDESAPAAGLEPDVLDCDLDLKNSSRNVWLVRVNVIEWHHS